MKGWRRDGGGRRDEGMEGGKGEMGICFREGR